MDVYLFGKTLHFKLAIEYSESEQLFHENKNLNLMRYFCNFCNFYITENLIILRKFSQN